MAVGKGSIKRASNAAKIKAGNEVVTEVAEEVKVQEVPDIEPKAQNADNMAKAKPITKSATKTKPTAKTKTTTKTTAKTTAKPATKTTAKTKTTTKPATKTTTKTTTAKPVANTKAEKKTYEVVEGISCNMPRYLL